MNLGKGKGDPSLLNRIGSHGILVLSDLTVLFSKSEESRATILSQFRMIYDGEMTKFSGTSDKPITWKGSLGVIAGSTPSIYSHFEKVSDMGERFIYYRMKDYDAEKATRLSMSRKIYGKELDEKLSELYKDYIKDVVLANKDTVITLSDETQERILQISMLAERIRTTSHTDWKGDTIDRIPVSAMPMRVALQLTAMAKGLALIRKYESDSVELTDKEHDMIDWCGYSLANEEKRACLKILCNIQYGVYAKTQIVADKVGLATQVIGKILQNLASVGVIERTGDTGSLSWRIKKQSDWNTIRRIEKVDVIEEYEDRNITAEEDEEQFKQDNLDSFGKEITPEKIKF
jgi:predicted transcriptional regulator